MSRTAKIERNFHNKNLKHRQHLRIFLFLPFCVRLNRVELKNDVASGIYSLKTERTFLKVFFFFFSHFHEIKFFMFIDEFKMRLLKCQCTFDGKTADKVLL